MHGFQRPDADYVDVDPLRDDAAAATPARSRSARSPARRTRFSTLRRLQDRPVSTATTWASCAAPTRRTRATGSSGATSSPASTCARATSTSTSMRAGTSAATASTPAATSTRTGPSRTTTASAAASTSMRRRSAIASRAAAPACSAIPARASGITPTPTIARRCRSIYNGDHWADTENSSRHGINPASTGAPPRRCRSTSAFRYFINHDDSQWVENEDLDDGATRYVFGRIDQTTFSINTRFNYTMTPNLSLQVYAEPFVSAGEYTELQGAGGRPRAGLRRPLPALRLRRQRRLQHPLVPHHQRAALGVPPGLGAVPGVAAGQARTTRTTATSASAATSAAFSTRRRNNVFLVKFSYWLNM